MRLTKTKEAISNIKSKSLEGILGKLLDEIKEKAGIGYIGVNMTDNSVIMWIL